MKKLLPIILLSIFPFIALSQQKLRNEVMPLLKSKETIDEAMKKTNDYLTEHPDDVDAMVLKGNVILKKYQLDVPQIALNANFDESIYSTSIGEIAEDRPVVPMDVANQISDVLLKAVKVNDKREDIHLGICYLYSISLQTDKLIAYLPVLKKHVKITKESPYSFADYARNLMERDDFEDGMKVYEAVARLFEENAGIYSDMDGEYFKKGDIENAKKYAAKSLKGKGIDEMSYGNAFFLYAILEDYDDALSALKMQCDLNGSKSYLIYEALLDLNQGKDWKSPLEKFRKSSHDKGAYKRLANYMLSDSFANTVESYKTMAEINLNDAYTILINKYFKSKIPDFFPAFNYAETLTNNFRYADAENAFHTIDTASLNQSNLDHLHFYYAWASYKNKDEKTAIKNWMPLLKSDNFYYQSAACYFLGKYYLEDQKNTVMANSYFSMVSNRASESKYANFCRNMMK